MPNLPASRTLLTGGLYALFFVTLASVCGQSPNAPSPSRTPPGLTLEDLVRISLEQNPALAQASVEIEIARGRAIQAGLYPNPRVSVVGEEMGGRDGPGGIITAPEINQEIVTAGKLRLSRAVADQEVDQAGLALTRQRYALLTIVRQGYFEILADQYRLEVLDELIKLATQSQDNAKKLLGLGEGAKPELLQFQIELNRLRAEQEGVERELDAAWRRLAAGIGAPDMPYTRLAGALDASVPEYDRERAQSYLLAIHPEVRIAQVGITRAQFAQRRAEVEPIPNVTVGAGYVRNNKDREDQWMFQVEVPVPLFNRNQGAIFAARAEVSRAVLEVDRARNELIRRLATAFGQYAAAKKRAERYRTSILPDARESHRLTLVGFRGGRLEYLQVLQAQRAVAEVNLEYIRTLADQWRAASDLAGLLLEDQWPPVPVQTLPVPARAR